MTIYIENVSQRFRVDYSVVLVMNFGEMLMVAIWINATYDLPVDLLRNRNRTISVRKTSSVLLKCSTPRNMTCLNCVF